MPSLHRCPMMPIDRCIEVFAKGPHFHSMFHSALYRLADRWARWLRDNPSLRARRRNDAWIARLSVDAEILRRLAHEGTKSGFTISSVTSNAEEEELLRARFR